LKFQFIIIFVLGLIFSGCKKGENKPETAFQEVYEMSEMALLMEEMYNSLEKDKELVQKQKTLGAIPNEFHKIHTAEMTTSFERTEEFKGLADLYLKNLHQLYQTEIHDPNRVESFNNTVKACITCHRSDAGCIGPVSRIGKLLIEVSPN